MVWWDTEVQVNAVGTGAFAYLQEQSPAIACWVVKKIEFDFFLGSLTCCKHFEYPIHIYIIIYIEISKHGKIYTANYIQ